jgi:hypothetical protein
MLYAELWLMATTKGSRSGPAAVTRDALDWKRDAMWLEPGIRPQEPGVGGYCSKRVYGKEFWDGALKAL